MTRVSNPERCVHCGNSRDDHHSIGHVFAVTDVDTLVATHALSIAPGEELTEVEVAEKLVADLACEYRTGCGIRMLELIGAVDVLLALRAKAGR